MAKSTIGRGQFSGKLGGDVFLIRNGMQVIRAYQPVVSNPKSTQQNFQRAKANLVGRISQIVPWQALSGLSGNKSQRRSRFLRIAMLNTTAGFVAGSTTEINAKLNREDVIFSEGAVLPTMSFATNTAVTANEISVTLSRLTGVDEDEFLASGALVVMVAKSSDGQWENVFYKFISGSDFSGNSYTFSFQHINEGGYISDGYICPFRSIDGSNLRTRTEELTGDATSFNALLSVNPSALPIEWGNSIFGISRTYTPNA